MVILLSTLLLNAADDECLGGGEGVGSVISDAGGPSLLNDRQKLPARYSASQEKYVRCRKGGALMTGPNGGTTTSHYHTH